MVEWLCNVLGWALDPVILALAFIGVCGWLIESCRSDRED